MSEIETAVEAEAAGTAAIVAESVAESVATETAGEVAVEVAAAAVQVMSDLAEEIAETNNEAVEREELQWLRNEMQEQEDRIVLRVTTALAASQELTSPSETEALTETMAEVAEELAEQEEILEESGAVEAATLDPLLDVPPPGENQRASRRRTRGLKRRSR